MKRGASSSPERVIDKKRKSRAAPPPKHKPNVDDLRIDRYRSIVFPNNVRDARKRSGIAKLLGLSHILPEIPYIRLSKIERGEIFAKPAELIAIANALRIKPVQLLIDIATPAFDIALWAAEFQDPAAFDADEDRVAVLLGAALRARRDMDPTLSIATLETDYGIPPVILSRLENAYKTLDRWNDATIHAICRLFGVTDVAALRAYVLNLHANGALDRHLDQVANPELRIAKTCAKVDALRVALARKPASRAYATAAEKLPPPRRITDLPAVDQATPSPVIAAIQASESTTVRLVPIFGAPLGDGLIARTPIGTTAEAPRIAGPNAYGLRICRPTLGPGMPGRATVIVDPDRFPSSGGLAVVREGEGLRLLMITFGRDGRMVGYSEHPSREVTIDDLDPADVATVVSAIFE